MYTPSRPVLILSELLFQYKNVTKQWTHTHSQYPWNTYTHLYALLHTYTVLRKREQSSFCLGLSFLSSLVFLLYIERKKRKVMLIPRKYYGWNYRQRFRYSIFFLFKNALCREYTRVCAHRPCWYVSKRRWNFFRVIKLVLIFISWLQQLHNDTWGGSSFLRLWKCSSFPFLENNEQIFFPV